MLLLFIRTQDMLKLTSQEEMKQKQGEVETERGHGYKFHRIIDRDYELIRRLETTTASVHDSQVDLSEENEVVYRDKGTSEQKRKVLPQ